MGPVTALAKAVADRPRPASALVTASSRLVSSGSFPSGHALAAMAAALAILAVLWPMIAARWRAAAAIGAAVVIVLVGVSRVVLTVHYVSDVVAGWALGFLWFQLCVTLVPPYRSADRTCHHACHPL